MAGWIPVTLELELICVLDMQPPIACRLGINRGMANFYVG